MTTHSDKAAKHPNKMETAWNFEEFRLFSYVIVCSDHLGGLSRDLTAITNHDKCDRTIKGGTWITEVVTDNT